MIGQLRGTLLEKQPPRLLVDVAGVGYEVEAPMTVFYDLPESGAELTLYTHFVVREDAQLLYGFTGRYERELFRSLIKVNGVGPKMALAILSGIEADRLAACIRDQDTTSLVKVPGIGKKTAERLVIEMSDRLDKLEGAPAARPGPRPLDGPPDGRADAIAALQTKLEALGISNVTSLRAWRREDLEARFGRWGGRLYELARGIDERPVQPNRPRKSISAEDTLPEDLPATALAPHIARMADKTWRSAQKTGARGRTVVLKLKTADFRILTRRATLAQPPASAEALARAATELLARVEDTGEERYRLVGVGLSQLEHADEAIAPTSEQQTLFD